jgi:cytochrome c-type biogenesis protein CcmH/NrfG
MGFPTRCPGLGATRHPVHGMIRWMSKSSVPLLLAGILAGFLVVYMAVRDRDPGPIVIRDPSILTPARVPTESEREMLAQLESRLTGTPADLAILTDLANLNWEIEDYAQAAVWYRRAIEISPFDADLHTDLGTALFYDDRLAEAVAAFDEALTLDPVHPQALINLGIVRLEGQGDREGAIALWEQFIATNPDDPRVEMMRQEIQNLRASAF